MVMVNKPGGPCIAIRKKKEEDGTHTMGVCNRTESLIWYGGNTKCKGCYESAGRIGKRKMEAALGSAVALDLEDLQEESQEILVEIEEIYAVRCEQSSNARPVARPSKFHPPPLDQVPPRLRPYTHTCSDLCV